jgi:hypothetical protein
VGDIIPKPPGPFKFTYHWPKDPKFRELVQNEGRHIDNQLEDLVVFHFSDILKGIKRKTIEWATIYFKDSLEHIQSLEEDIENNYNSNMNGIFNES